MLSEPPALILFLPNTASIPDPAKILQDLPLAQDHNRPSYTSIRSKSMDFVDVGRQAGSIEQELIAIDHTETSGGGSDSREKGEARFEAMNIFVSRKIETDQQMVEVFEGIPDDKMEGKEDSGS